MEAIPTLVLVSAGLACFALWVVALASVIRTPAGGFRTGSKLGWLLVVVIGQLLGALVYLWVGRPANPSPR